jgi:hypothetical protein
MEEQESTKISRLANPVVVIALLIIVGIFVLIGAAILGIDRGVLTNMARIDFARGLITYLFAVVTIGTAVVLVVSALTNEPTPEVERRFQHGKEILALLLGVFGTIVGYYFGSEEKAQSVLTRAGGVAESVSGVVQITPPLLKPSPLVGGRDAVVTAAAVGGVPPYQFEIVVGGVKLADEKMTIAGNWVTGAIQPPATNTSTTIAVKVKGTDSGGQSGTASTAVTVEPR